MFTHTPNESTDEDGVITFEEIKKYTNAEIEQKIPAEASSTNKLATASDIENIQEVIPAEATAENKLADKSWVNGEIGKITSFDIVVKTSKEELPTTGVKGTLYFVPNGTSGDNSYDEYIWNTTDSKYEMIGQKDIDLSDYAKKNETLALSIFYQMFCEGKTPTEWKPNTAYNKGDYVIYNNCLYVADYNINTSYDTFPLNEGHFYAPFKVSTKQWSNTSKRCGIPFFSQGIQIGDNSSQDEDLRQINFGDGNIVNIEEINDDEMQIKANYITLKASDDIQLNAGSNVLVYDNTAEEYKKVVHAGNFVFDSSTGTLTINV